MKTIDDSLFPPKPDVVGRIILPVEMQEERMQGQSACDISVETINALAAMSSQDKDVPLQIFKFERYGIFNSVETCHAIAFSAEDATIEISKMQGEPSEYNRTDWILKESIAIKEGLLII